MIDLHCHYLPFVDDGPVSVQQAVDLVALSLSRGISHAVLTPHFYPGVWNNTLETLRPGFDAFVRLLAQSELDMHLTLAGEVRLHPECLDMAAHGTLPTLGVWEGDRVVLLELPDGQIPVGADAAVSLLRSRGYRPMIAHPERNKDVMADYRRMKPFVDAGCLLQLTAASVIGGFGASAQRAALQLLDVGAVAVIATDAHNVAHRPPLLAEARAALLARYGAQVAEELTLTTPARILGIEVALPPEGGTTTEQPGAVMQREPSESA